MRERFLSAEIYYDEATRGVSAEPALEGIEIVKGITPWIKVVNTYAPVGLGHESSGVLNVDEATWPKTDADITIVVTGRELVETDTATSQHAQSTNLDYLGWTLTWLKPKPRRVAVVNTGHTRRPEHIVAHEIGHIFDVADEKEGLHCQDKQCLMFPMQYPYGKADRTFCECCSLQLFENSQARRRAKTGKFMLRATRTS